MSSSDLVVLRYVTESVMGTSPTTPPRKHLRYTSEGLVYNIENVQSAEITPTRVETDTVQVSGSASGPINFELSYGTFDDFIASALCGAWGGSPGDTLYNGNTFESYTVQKHFQQMEGSPSDLYHNYTGLVIDGLNLRMEIGRIVTGSFTTVAFGNDQAVAQFAGATFPAVSTTTPMNAATNFQSLEIDAVPYTGCISSIELNVRNNVTPRMCIGSAQAQSMKWGKLQVTGSMSLYFAEPTNYQNFIDGAEFAVTWSLVDIDGNEYACSLPRVKFETCEVVSGGTNTDVMLSGNIRALYDGSSVVSITRTAA